MCPKGTPGGLFVVMVLLLTTLVLLGFSLRRAFKRPLNENRDAKTPTMSSPVSSNPPLISAECIAKRGEFAGWFRLRSSGRRYEE